ncbi:hypothetical protein ACFL0L_03020 [Patescibacteria group bacterium]
MFDTTKDILYLVLAIGVVVLTFFLGWSLYYVTMMLKRAHAVFKEVEGLISGIKDRLQQLESLFKKIEEKVTSSASYLPLLMKGVTELLSFVKKRRENKKAKKSTA